MFEALDPVRFNLIVIGQEVADGSALPLGDLVRLHVAATDDRNAAELERCAIPTPSFYLLRPDGHIGLCGTVLASQVVARYVREQLLIVNADG